jgi:hypothetical protein
MKQRKTTGGATMKKLKSHKQFERYIPMRLRSQDFNILQEHISQTHQDYLAHFPNHHLIERLMGMMTIQIGHIKFKLSEDIWKLEFSEWETYLNIWLELRKDILRKGSSCPIMKKVYLNIRISKLTPKSIQTLKREGWTFRPFGDLTSPEEQGNSNNIKIVFADKFRFDTTLNFDSDKKVLGEYKRKCLKEYKKLQKKKE